MEFTILLKEILIDKYKWFFNIMGVDLNITVLKELLPILFKKECIKDWNYTNSSMINKG